MSTSIGLHRIHKTNEEGMMLPLSKNGAVRIKNITIDKISDLQNLILRWKNDLIKNETLIFVCLNETSEIEYEKLKHPLIITLQNTESLLTLVTSQLKVMENFVSRYDPSIGGEVNGYRSFIEINGKAIDQLVKEFAKNTEDKTTLFSHSLSNGFSYWIKYLEKLSHINSYLIEIQRISSQQGFSFFPDTPDIKEIQELESVARTIAVEDVSIFLDQGLAMHINEEPRKLLKTVLVGQSYSALTPFLSTKSYKEILTSLLFSLGGIKYLLDSQYLSKQALSNARTEQVTFCKKFYNFPEFRLINKMSKLNCPNISTNELIPIEPKPIFIKDNQNWQLSVNPPEVHIGKKILNARLLSNFRTEEMAGDCLCYTKLTCSCRKKTSPSRSILLHFHGSAFVSQTSMSSETYLTIWAKECDIPILSVDYSLAPEAPYPRAMEEAFYAYVWMRNNFLRLGTTGENVIFAGDSAGGTVITSLVLQCIEKDIPLPNHLFLFYPCLLVQMFPSPSRLLSLLDPLAMFPFLLRCMNAYTDPFYQQSCPRTYEEELDASLNTNQDPLMSPLLASLKTLSLFPRTHIFSSTMDTCLDECVEFTNKLKKAGAGYISLDIFEGLPHGFMSLNGLSEECQNAVSSITQHIKSTLPDE